MGIYVRAGGDIYSNRQRLLRISNEQSTSHASTIDNPFQASKTTEISFVSESVDKGAVPGSQIAGPVAAHNPYSVVVTGPEQRSRFDIENEPRHHSQARDFEMPQAVRFPTTDNQHSHQQMSGRRAMTQTDNANWAYAKVAVLFFVGLMVTWIPSSANRVYSYVHPGEISLGLEFASAFVLPLQGFWNSIIYATTSIPACKSFWRELRGHKVFSSQPLRRVSTNFSPNNESSRDPPSSRGGVFTEIDSLTTIESRRNSRASRTGVAR